MSSPSERILLVETDPETIDLIIHQVMEPMGYKVDLATDASAGIEKAVQDPPDLVIVNLELPDLSGKDLLVALASHGLNIPAIVIARPKMENDIVQAVRLGASDYLYLPVRETELVSVLERALRKVHHLDNRDQVIAELKQTNQDLRRRAGDLAALCVLGRTLSSLTEEKALCEKILQAGIYLGRADRGWVLLKKNDKDFSLSSYHNLPGSILPKDDQDWEDGLSTLVALSGESLSIHGEALSRFKVSKLGRAALVIPISGADETLGVIAVMRKSNRPFSEENLKLLELLADFSSINLVKMRLEGKFAEHSKSHAEKAHSTDGEEKGIRADVPKLSPEMRKELVLANAYIGMLVDEQLGRLKDEQLNALEIIREKLHGVVAQLETGMSPENLA